MLLVKPASNIMGSIKQKQDVLFWATLPFPLPGLYCPPLASFPLRLGWRFLNACPLKLSLAEEDDAEDDAADWELLPTNSPAFVIAFPLLTPRSEV